MNPNNNDNDPTTITKRSSTRIIPTQLPDTWNLLRIYQRRGRNSGDHQGNNNYQDLPDIVLVQGSVVDFGSSVSNTTKPKKKKAAAIVNAANEICLGGGGVDGAITDAGGPNLARDRLNLPIICSGRDSSSGGDDDGSSAKKDEDNKNEKNDNKKRSRSSDDNEEHPSDEENGSSMSVGSSSSSGSSSGNNRFGGVRCPTGTAVMTGPGDYGELHVPYVIHAVGPNYWDYNMSYEMVQQGHQLLRGAYMQSLDLASTEIHEIAFCLLSAGIFRGRLKLMTVLRVGLESIFDWRQNNSDKTTTSSTLERIYICGFNHRECDILVAVGDGLAARRGSSVSIVLPPADGDDYDNEKEEEVAVAMETVPTTTPETPRDQNNDKSLDTDDGSKPFDEVEDQKKEAGVWTAVVNAVAEQQKVDDENDTNTMAEYEKQKNDTTKKSAAAVDTSMSSIETPPPPPPLPPVVLKTTTTEDQKEAVEMVQGGDDDDTNMTDKQKNDTTKISPAAATAVDTSMSSIETPPPPPPVLLEATTTDDQKKAVVAAQKDDDDTNMAEEGEKKDTKPPAVDTSLSSIDGPSPRPVLETTTTDDQKKKTSSSSSPVVGIEAASGDHEMAED